MSRSRVSCRMPGGGGTLEFVASSPRVSVVVTVYNGERFLEEALRSILDQSFTELELVVVDDGSSDRTLEVAHSIRDNRLKVVAEGRVGRAAALNRALEEAEAPLVALMDADDVALRSRIARQVEFLNTNPEVGFVGTWFTAISEDGRPLYTKTTLLRDPDLRRRFLVGTPVAGGTAMIRRTVFDEVGGFRAAFVPSEDSDLWRRAIMRVRAANIPEVLYLYRMRPGSLSDAHRDVQDRHRRTIVADLWRTLEVPTYGVGEIRSSLAFYRSVGGPHGAEVVREYLWHERELFNGFVRHGSIVDAARSLSGLLLVAPSVAPIVGRMIRLARRLVVARASSP
jgi:glycosyltransferase involved in cell wall biosynthesis